MKHSGRSIITLFQSYSLHVHCIFIYNVVIVHELLHFVELNSTIGKHVDVTGMSHVACSIQNQQDIELENGLGSAIDGACQSLLEAICWALLRL